MIHILTCESCLQHIAMQQIVQFLIAATALNIVIVHANPILAMVIIDTLAAIGIGSTGRMNRVLNSAGHAVSVVRVIIYPANATQVNQVVPKEI